MIQHIKKHNRLITVISAILILVGLIMAILIPRSVSATDYTISTNTTWDDASDVPNDIGNLTVDSGATLTVGGGAYDAGGFTISGTGTLHITGNSKIAVAGEILNSSTGYEIVFSFMDVTIDSGSSIDGDGNGFDPSEGPGAGPGNNSGSAGGSYGGKGGEGYFAPVDVYGSEIAPISLGSGGGPGNWGVLGGYGGGAIKITASGAVTVNGDITMDGATGSGEHSSGGSGGSIYIVTSSIAGAGNLSVDGGAAERESSLCGSGAGGRIAVVYSSGNTFSTSNATANGSTVGGDGENGTVVFVDSNYNDAYIYTSYSFDAALGVGADLSQASDGIYYFRNLTIADNASILIRSTGSSPNGKGPTLDLSGSFSLGVGAIINGNGAGYDYQQGPGAGSGDNNGSSGGGFGGAGGDSNYGGFTGGSTYGSASGPIDLGSGGGKGTWDTAGGKGGGAIKIDADGNVVVNGTITVDGTTGSGEHSGGGSGGSIYLITGGILSGNGVLSADGGNAQSGSYGGGGGGGRVSIVYTNSDSFSASGTKTVAGGTGVGGGSNGSAGTNNVYAKAVVTPVSVDGEAVAGSPTGSSIDPVFIATVSEGETNNLKTKIQIATDSGFTQNVQTFDQTISQTGWSGQNADSNTTYISGSSATYTVQTSLTPKTTYYWRAAAIAPSGQNSWGNWSSAYSFITNAKPQITSLTASQDSSAAVNISYTLSDEDDSSATVSFQYWDGTAYQEATTTTGEGSKASGSGGTAHTGTWTAKSDYNSQYTAGMKIRVTADDGNTGGINTAESTTFTFDTVNPSIATFTIASDASYTNSASVTLNISVSDNTSLQMQFSNDNSVWGTATDTSGSVTNNGTYENYATSKTGWYLTAGDDGTRTVYIRAKDAKGNTATTSDTISLNLVNPTTPIGVEVIDVSTSGGPYRHFLLWDANADGDFSSYTIRRKTDAGSYIDLATITNQSTDYYLDESLLNTSTYYYKIKVTDIGANASTSSEVFNQPDSADTTAPTITDTPSSSSITTQTAIISWTTNEASSSIVDYGADTNYGLSVGDSAELVTSHSVQLTGLSPNSPYYFRVKSSDSSGNTGSKDNSGSGYTVTTNAAPVISLVGSGTPGQTSATIVWTTTTNSSSLVDWGTNSTPDNGWVTDGDKGDSTTSHSVTLSGLSQNTTYYFQVSSRDLEGNLTTDNNGGSYYSFDTVSDSTAPTISTGPTVSNTLNNSAVISWQTTEAATTQLSYSTTNGFSWATGTISTLQSEKDYNHTVSLSGLIRNTTYYVLARSIDATNNTVTSSQVSFTTTGDNTSPVISLVSAGSVTETGAVISWLTDEPATTQVNYGTDINNLSFSTTEDAKLDRNHRVTLSNLDSGTVYYYQIISKDGNSNQKTFGYTDDNTLTFTTLTTPTVSDVLVGDTTTVSTASITWTSNVAADSMVEYGADSSSLTSSQGKHDDSATSHTVVLSGLSVETTYYFRVKSTDSEGNVAYSAVANFTTAADTDASSDIIAPTIAGDSPTVSLEARSVAIAWSTDEASNSIIRYGASAALDLEAGKDDAVTSHSVSLTGLSPSTTYYYEIRSKDSSGNVGTLTGLSFTTKNEGVISDVEASDLTLTSAIISWATNIVTTSVFNYGTDKNMSSSITDQSLGSTTNHTIRLSDLTEGTKYYYQVSGVDEDGNLVQSDQYQFSTLPMPTVTQVNLGEVLARTAVISWTTNVPTTSLVNFGKDSASQSQGSTDQLTSHKVTLQALEPNTDYIYQIKSTDQYGNSAPSDSYSFTTKSDTYPPVISQIKSEISSIGSGESARVQAIITWLTDEPATSQIAYGAGVASGDLSHKSSLDSSFNQSHVLVLKNLTSSTAYRFKVISEDETGNRSKSSDYTILTPEKQASTLQIIVKLLEETFSFIPSLFSK